MEAEIKKPTSIRIRKLEPWVVLVHSKNAENAGISMEEHLRRVLKEQALQAQHAFADEMEKVRDEIFAEVGRDFPDSTDAIRAAREEPC